MGRAIARRREDLGLTQPELAARLGWSKQTLGRVERGERALRNEGEIIMIARALEMPEEDLRSAFTRESGRGPDDVTIAELAESVRRLEGQMEEINSALGRVDFTFTTGTGQRVTVELKAPGAALASVEEIKRRVAEALEAEPVTPEARAARAAAEVAEEGP